MTASATTWASTAGGTRSLVEMPDPSYSSTPMVSIFRSSSASMIAADAPAKLGGAPRAIATCRASASASTLSEFSSAWASSTDIGWEETCPMTVRSSGAVPAICR